MIPVWSCEGHANREEETGGKQGNEHPYVVVAALNTNGLHYLDTVIGDLMSATPSFWELSVCKLVTPEGSMVEPEPDELYPAWTLRAKFAYTEEEMAMAREQLLSAVTDAQPAR